MMDAAKAEATQQLFAGMRQALIAWRAPLPPQSDPDWFRPQAAAAVETRDAGALLSLMGNADTLPFVAAHHHQLKLLGMLEVSLLHAYVTTSTDMPTETLRALFQAADGEWLRALGDPMPVGQAFDLFRGSAGSQPKRDVRGLVWTLDPEHAAWLACRRNLADPGVYTATVPRSAVLFACSRRGERELVVDLPPGCRTIRLPLSSDQVKRAAERFAEVVRQRSSLK